MNINEETANKILDRIADTVGGWAHKFGPMDRCVERTTLKQCYDDIHSDFQSGINEAKEVQSSDS